jgi:multisubunit Na+/H+ antiporter MnhB subunit
MTEKSSLIPRIMGVILAALLFIAILVMVLAAIQPFQLDRFSGAVTSTLIPVNNYGAAGGDVPILLWIYRGIDTLLLGVLLVAAAIGAGALFRVEKGEEKSKEE